MRVRFATWLAWSLAGLALIMYVAGIVMYVLARSAQVPNSLITEGTVGDLLVFVPFLAFPVVGALIASRRPRNPIGWICLADGLMWMLVDLIDRYSAYGVARTGSVPYPVAIGALSGWLWVPAVGLPGIYLILLFPDGRLPSKRWRSLAWLSGAVLVLLSLSIALAPGPLQNLGGMRNPFGLEGHPWVADMGIFVLPMLPLCMLASAVGLVLRFRRSSGETRQQIKWVAFAASFVGLVYLVAMASSLVFAPDAGVGAPLWLDLATYLALLSFAGVPAAIGLAVLKYRLYDIDLLINRTLVYGALTVALGLVYFGSVVLFQGVFRALAGQGSQLVVVASTLAIAALFDPLRRRIQGSVDRRFYRKKYDARKTLAAFSAKLRDETDLNALSEDIVSVVRETMQPAHVSLWLRTPDDKVKR